MKIAVNSRMVLEKGTGVPNYINYVYQSCQKLDQANKYIFFQPNLLRQLGETRLAWSPGGLAGAAWFDTFQADRLIGKTTPDIFHGPSHILPWRKRRGVKYVVTIHDLAFRVFPDHYNRQHLAYYGWQVARSLKMADVVMADSHNTKRDIIKFYQTPAERIEVVHLGVAEHFFKAAEDRPPRAVAGKYFLSITTHPRRKNILGALRAFATFANKSDVQYVVAGLMGEPQRQEFLALAESLGVSDKVKLYGYVSDSQLISLYQNAEFAIYPSFYEGFGLPVVEAMACGCPVIAANNSSLPEILPDAEWLVDPYDAESMAAKMQASLALTTAAREQIRKKNQLRSRGFTWDQTAEKMMRIFAA
jgi:glycosyltransferase involved in cell wall biosynthesis